MISRPRDGPAFAPSAASVLLCCCYRLPARGHLEPRIGAPIGDLRVAIARCVRVRGGTAARSGRQLPESRQRLAHLLHTASGDRPDLTSLDVRANDRREIDERSGSGRAVSIAVPCERDDPRGEIRGKHRDLRIGFIDRQTGHQS